jgi:hypothetical protein
MHMGSCNSKKIQIETVVPGAVEISKTRYSRSTKSLITKNGVCKIQTINIEPPPIATIQAAYVQSPNQIVEFPIPEAVYNHPQFKEASSLWQFIQHQQVSTRNHNASMAQFNLNPIRSYISLVPLQILREMLNLAAMEFCDCKALFSQSSLKQLTQTINIILPGVRGHWLVELLQRLKEVAFATANAGRISNARRVSVVYAGPQHSYSSAHLPNAFTLTWLKHGASMIHNGALWTLEFPCIRLAPLGEFKDKQVRIIGAILNVDSDTQQKEEGFEFYYFRIELLPCTYQRQTSNIDFTALQKSLQNNNNTDDNIITNNDDDSGIDSWKGQARPSSPVTTNKILSIRMFLNNTIDFGPQLDEVFELFLKDPTISLSLLLQDMHFASEHFRVAAAEQATAKSSQRILLCLQRWMILCALHLLQRRSVIDGEMPQPPLQRSKTAEEKCATAVARYKRTKTEKFIARKSQK